MLSKKEVQDKQPRESFLNGILKKIKQGVKYHKEQEQHSFDACNCYTDAKSSQIRAKQAHELISKYDFAQDDIILGLTQEHSYSRYVDAIKHLQRKLPYMQVKTWNQYQQWVKDLSYYVYDESICPILFDCDWKQVVRAFVFEWHTMYICFSVGKHNFVPAKYVPLHVLARQFKLNGDKLFNRTPREFIWKCVNKSELHKLTQALSIAARHASTCVSLQECSGIKICRFNDKFAAQDQPLCNCMCLESMHQLVK